VSLAGVRSSQGDEYQLRVALHWLIRLLQDNSIHGLQVNSVGIPGQDFAITVDDVVVLYIDGRALCIQAKKNQPQHHSWSFNDQTLQEEIRKARDLLEAREHSEAGFYSRSPFGEFKLLVENCRIYPDFASFQRTAPTEHHQLLAWFAKIIDRPQDRAYDLAKLCMFGPTRKFDDWDNENRQILDRIVPHTESVMPVLERYLASHETKLRNAPALITRGGILAELEQWNIIPTPKRSEAEILDTFRRASNIGRQWLRTIAGEKITRPELRQLITLIEQQKRSILLTDRPGSGKTCVLLDLAEYIEQQTQ